MKYRHLTIIIGVIVLCVGMCFSSIFAGSVSLYYNDDYESSLTCPGSQSLGTYSMLYTYDDEMTAHGHNTNLNWIDPSSAHRYITDVDLAGYGLDHYYAEIDDFVFFTGHGLKCTLNDIKQSCLRVRNSYNGEDGATTCKIYPRHEMILGENTGDDIEFLHLTQCHSMSGDDDRWRNTWRPVFHGIHQILGFHGTGADGRALRDYFQAFAHEAQLSPVAHRWVANLFVRNYWDDQDLCPVAYTADISLDLAIDRLNNETYSNRESFYDRSNPTNYRRLYNDSCL